MTRIVGLMIAEPDVRALMMPLSLLNFFANTGAICNALRKFYWNRFWGSGGDGWYKTHRTRLSGEGPRPRNGAGAARRSLRGLYYSDSEGGNG